MTQFPYLRWHQSGSEYWELRYYEGYGGTFTSRAVAGVTEEVLGLTTRRYKAWVSTTDEWFLSTEDVEAQTFTTLEDALTWAQTTYRLTK